MSLMRYTLYGMCATIYKNYCFVHTISLSFSFVRFYCRHHHHRRCHCHCCCWLRRSRHEIKSACKLLEAIPFYHQSTLVALLPFHTLHSAAIGWCWLTAWLVDLLLLQYLYVEYFYSWSFAFNEMLSLFFPLPRYMAEDEREHEKKNRNCEWKWVFPNQVNSGKDTFLAVDITKILYYANVFGLNLLLLLLLLYSGNHIMMTLR